MSYGGCELPESERGSTTFMIEAICTFIFVMVNLVVKFDPASPTTDGYLKCLGVAISLFAMITLAGPYTGASINMAVSFAQTTYVVTQMGNPD